jgi:S1-C subfamily serine protease
MSTDWKIPSKLQPAPTDYRFDLDRALAAVVTVKSNIPANAFTAGILGTERIGSGAVIRPDGLVLTIGYLITEADSIWIVSGDGRAVPGHAVAVDAETGFGLVQPLGRRAARRIRRPYPCGRDRNRGASALRRLLGIHAG